MKLSSLLFISALFVGLSPRAKANLQPLIDPDIGMDSGGFSDAIHPGVNFNPICNPMHTMCGGVFDYYNPTGGFITSLEFQTTVQTNLPDGTFHCNAAQFFKMCTLDYTGSTGLLTIDFNGTNPQEPGESPFDPELGPNELEGIPPIPPGCLPNGPNPNSLCDSIGHFVITLNDNFSTTGSQGSWDQVFPDGCVPTPDHPCIKFDTTQVVSSVPEPSVIVLLAAACLLIFASRQLSLRIRGRRSALPEHGIRGRV